MVFSKGIIYFSFSNIFCNFISISNINCFGKCTYFKNDTTGRPNVNFISVIATCDFWSLEFMKII